MNGREFNIVGKEIILIQMHRKTKAIDCGNGSELLETWSLNVMMKRTQDVEYEEMYIT